MRHRKSHRKLGVTASHRKALIASLSTALLKHKKIRTTVAKAKETRMFVEKLITRARRAHGIPDDKARNVHERRMVARTIKDKVVVRELFGEIAGKVASRPGGYTRIVKLGRRQGDGAEVAILELVDFQGAQPKQEKDAKAGKSEGQGKSPKAAKKGYSKKGSEKKEKAGALAKEAASAGA
jgi:large subunit ribosomal protein L17